MKLIFHQCKSLYILVWDIVIRVLLPKECLCAYAVGVNSHVRACFIVSERCRCYGNSGVLVDCIAGVLVCC